MPKLRPPESTSLTSTEEAAYQAWLAQNHIMNADAPEAHYDMRGFWKATHGAPHPPGSEQHFPDTFKQHGHPSFSQESQYSQGPWDGGMWVGPNGVSDPLTTLLEQPPMAVSHLRKPE